MELIPFCASQWKRNVDRQNKNKLSLSNLIRGLGAASKFSKD